MLITNEVGELKKVGLFGPPGIETYLAQFFDPKVSLFFDRFDVIKGQKEFKGLQKLIESLGIEVINLKCVYATLTAPTVSAEQLLDRLKSKVPDCDGNTLETLFETDVGLYGETEAVALNEALSLKPKIPKGNIYFARDQSNVFFDTCVLGNMAFDIRKSEVAVVYAALKALGYNKFFQVTEGTFEGGDGMVINGSVYIGSGMRTTPSAAKQIAQHLGVPTYMVEIPKSRDWRTDMEMMHLDTFFMPLTPDTVIGCEEILGSCSLINLYKGTTVNFLKYLKDNFNVLNVPREEQKNYAANMLVVSPGKVIVPSDYNKQTNQTLQSNGIQVIYAELRELTQGVGATHCMALQIEKH